MIEIDYLTRPPYEGNERGIPPYYAGIRRNKEKDLAGGLSPDERHTIRLLNEFFIGAFITPNTKITKQRK